MWLYACYHAAFLCNGAGALCPVFKKSQGRISGCHALSDALLTIFTVPMFASHYNFGRLDIYCVFLSLLGAMLLIQGKAEWLLIPISALGVMVHQGYVFMFFNIILVLLMYKILSTEGKERKKYITIFALSLLVACILFFWFELFAHANGNGIYEEIVASAKKLCKNRKIHQDVVDKEILGIDLTGREGKNTTV